MVLWSWSHLSRAVILSVADAQVVDTRSKRLSHAETDLLFSIQNIGEYFLFNEHDLDSFEESYS